MSLRDYEVPSDYFETEITFGFAFPCLACMYRHGTQQEHPCSGCGHNMNAELEQSPEKSSPGACDRREDLRT